MNKTGKHGSVHGRFQPLHNEHLEYILEALKRCDFLYIGITQFDVTPAHLNPLGRPREKPTSNPLKYFERLTMIKNALLDAGIARERFEFVPFPIEHADSLPAFLPMKVLCFTTICEEWNREKIAQLRRVGYEVDILWEREKNITGSDIRDRMARGDATWVSLVPPATARYAEEIGLAKRISDMMAAEQSGTE